MTFTVIDKNTGHYPDCWEIALKEEWAKNLCYCDIEGFAIKEDGTLVLLDECGSVAYCPEGRFRIIPELKWIPVTERLPECDLGVEVGNIEWISCGMVHSGCFGRGGKYRDAYFRTWTDAGEGMDAKDADYWRQIQIPEPPKEET